MKKYQLKANCVFVAKDKTEAIEYFYKYLKRRTMAEENYPEYEHEKSLVSLKEIQILKDNEWVNIK